MEKLIIDRKRWLCGKLGAYKGKFGGFSPGETSQLYRANDRRMCCLGFAARQLYGAKVNDIIGKRDPGETNNTKIEWPKWLLADPKCVGLINSTEYVGLGNYIECNLLMKINDNIDLNSKEREKKVREMFAKHDIKVVFRGTYK